MRKTNIRNAKKNMKKECFKVLFLRISHWIVSELIPTNKNLNKLFWKNKFLEVTLKLATFPKWTLKPTKAQQNYAKLIEKNDSNIQDQDRLRVQSSDKEALAQRSKEELDRQTKLFEKQNSTFYDEGLFQTFFSKIFSKLKSSQNWNLNISEEN